MDYIFMAYLNSLMWLPAFKTVLAVTKLFPPWSGIYTDLFNKTIYLSIRECNYRISIEWFIFDIIVSIIAVSCQWADNLS